MLNVGELNEGFVLDHIEAGKAMMIYNYLGLDKLDCQVAIIKNARSGKMGKKDIIKIEGGLDLVDLDVLGFVDHNITVNIIKNGEIVDKKRLSLPKQVTNIIKCKNPRCITSIEQGLKQVFVLADDFLTEIFFKIFSDYEYNLSKSATDSIKNGIVHNCFTIGSQTVKLFQTSITTSHSGSQNY